MHVDAYKHKAKKSLGQNFLRDPNIARKIVAQLEIGPEDKVIEIGPGPGALTQWIVEAGPADYLAIEKDANWAEELTRNWPGARVAHADALEYPWEEAGAGQGGAAWKVAGNLPYNVASPLMWEIVSRVHGLSRAVFMIQKEVAERLVASPGTKAYGALSVWIQSFAHARLAFVVPPHVFRPRPKVDSAVVVLTARERGLGCPPGALNALLKRCFQLRRKQMQKILRDYWDAGVEAILEECGLTSQARPEALAPECWEKLANHMKNRV